MSPGFWGWLVPMLVAPVALYFSLRRRAKRDVNKVQTYSKKRLVFAAILSSPLLIFLMISVVEALRGNAFMWVLAACFLGILVAFAVELVRYWGYELEVVGSSVRVSDPFKGEIVVRPVDIEWARRVEARGAVYYSVRLKDGRKLKLNVAEFQLGPLEGVLAVMDARGRAEGGRRGRAGDGARRGRGGRAGDEVRRATSGGVAREASGEDARGESGESKGELGALAGDRVALGANTRERLLGLASEVLESGSGDERSRAAVALELEAAADLLTKSPAHAVRHLDRAKREVVNGWHLRDPFGEHVLKVANAVIEGLARR